MEYRISDAVCSFEGTGYSKEKERRISPVKTSDFNYYLPPELIAQSPADQRDHSRLLHLGRTDGAVEHKMFYELPEFLLPGDLLVLNDSRVIPARLFGTRIPTGAQVQFLLLEQKEPDLWEVLVRPGRRAKVGDHFDFQEGLLHCEIVAIVEGGNRLAKFSYTGEFYSILDTIGQLPLPEYIHETPEDLERYQTVFSKHRGSAAAPTAGLHFTDELLGQLEDKGVQHAFVTLHVGLGTFRPVKVEEVTQHTMHSENYWVTPETAAQINATKARGGRVIAVGTTACRTLESIGKANHGTIVAGSGSTDIFIYPGYEFSVLDGLLTNFHLPESTLIMLVSAFAGKNHVMAAYQQAIENKYRFFSFGDAMFIE